MKERPSEEQIVGILREAEAGVAIKDLQRSRFGGMSASEAKPLKELEAEYSRLKKLLAELMPDASMNPQADRLGLHIQPLCWASSMSQGVAPRETAGANLFA